MGTSKNWILGTKERNLFSRTCLCYLLACFMSTSIWFPIKEKGKMKYRNGIDQAAQTYWIKYKCNTQKKIYMLCRLDEGDRLRIDCKRIAHSRGMCKYNLYNSSKRKKKIYKYKIESLSVCMTCHQRLYISCTCYSFWPNFSKFGTHIDWNLDQGRSQTKNYSRVSI